MSQATVMVNEETAIPIAEIVWQFSRSSGPGGQNVNKTATRVELLFDVRELAQPECWSKRTCSSTSRTTNRL